MESPIRPVPALNQTPIPTSLSARSCTTRAEPRAAANMSLQSDGGVVSSARQRLGGRHETARIRRYTNQPTVVVRGVPSVSALQLAGGWSST